MKLSRPCAKRWKWTLGFFYLFRAIHVFVLVRRWTRKALIDAAIVEFQKGTSVER